MAPSLAVANTSRRSRSRSSKAMAISHDAVAEDHHEDDDASSTTSPTNTNNKNRNNKKKNVGTRLADFVSLLEHPEGDLLTMLEEKHDPQNLRSLCQILFAQVEQYHRLLHQKVWRTSKTRRSRSSRRTSQSAAAIHDHVPMTLAGMNRLYVGPEPRDATTTAATTTTNAVDAETVWGQVDLQNEALRKLLRSQVKKLSLVEVEDIRLLDLDQIVGHDASHSKDTNDEDHDDDDNDDEDNEDESKDDTDENKEESDVDDDAEEEEEEEEDENVDDETKRIRARMARTMAMMDSDDDEENDSDNEEDEESDDDAGRAKGKDSKTTTKTTTDDDDAIDPIREKMMDGFFDLHEMEAFADEEEEFLPDEAYGKEEPETQSATKKDKSFHQKQRDGDYDVDRNDDNDNDDDDDAESDNELETRRTLVRRKKYRPQEEVDALFQIYDKPNDDDDDSAINMTAAEFFGKPNVKAMKRYKPMDRNHGNDDDGDADSWDHHDFDDAKGWRDDENNNSDDDDDSNGDGDDRSDGEDEDDNEDPPTLLAKANRKKTTKLTMQEERLLKLTNELEQEMLAEKPWHMIGEAKGTARPVNSLIESTPEFETATKAAPIITVEHSKSIEDIVKKRILNEDWDNIVPRELPDVGWNMKRGELPEVSQEKSKLGLGELYEREYLKKAVGYDKTSAEKETEESKAKDEMKALFASLCSKLDALSNYHFAPRPIADEAEVRTISTPAIAMEEVLPLHVSAARGVAPEEVYAAKHGRDSVLRGESELTQIERKRLRNGKKAARRKARQSKLADEKLISRLQPSGVGLSNPYEKRKMREELQTAHARGKVTIGQADATSGYGKSTQFFQRLQTETENGGADNSRKRKHIDTNAPEAKPSSAYKL